MSRHPLIRMCANTSAPFICVLRTTLSCIQMSHVASSTHSYVCHITWLIHMCAKNNSFTHTNESCPVTHSFIRVCQFTWRIRMCAKTHSFLHTNESCPVTHSFVSVPHHVTHSYVCEKTLFHAHKWVMSRHSLIRKCATSCDSFICVWKNTLSRTQMSHVPSLTHSYVWKVTWLIRMYAQTHSHAAAPPLTHAHKSSHVTHTHK